MAGTLRKTMLYLGLADDRAEADGYDGTTTDETETDVAHEHEAQVTPLRRATPVAAVATPEAPSHELRRITTIHPRSYNDARTIGEAFRGGTPVIMNLTDMDDADAKRLVDFSAGLIFGLHGAIERVTSKVFLLSPATVEIAGEVAAAADPAPRTGFFNQS
ncbi:cell division protein SepF [Cellulomonas marina]|uniref:Cell division protein SepF n=1 Tax=Cellulomonas marina TaxID=988821 RepID=A0A1I0VLA2_9CELL|nr:cell division protein SepF [Cellulomonas marina]GIG27897.1 cell division protein SepF [Cellulomonas marina]SFA77102.1 cell division inhibitor SepF [Cellulomonas marina]